MFSEGILLNSNYSKDISCSYSCHNLPRFRWYNYKEGFAPELVEDAIKCVNVRSDDYLLDPFNGNGTVTLTSSINNINSIGIEVNPFSAFISKAKQINSDVNKFERNIDLLLNASLKQKESFLLYHSTFSELSGKSKWLFNSDVIKSFEGGWNFTLNLSGIEKNLYQLALIGAAMDNCNATKDGKCLKYRKNWKEKKYNHSSFIDSLENRLKDISEDLKVSITKTSSQIINYDSRKTIKHLPEKFRLCITSPPYLNSFDYTDIYRPELFLGKFVTNNDELRFLRFKTIRSHVEMKLPIVKVKNLGYIFNGIQKKINNAEYFWDAQIPLMIEGYFEDLRMVLEQLKSKALKRAQLWIIVSNSVYANIEIPVDLILAEIGTITGWKLSRIEVLRNIQRRKTKYNGKIKELRESLIVFINEK